MEALLEQILYELRVSNWYSRGCKGEEPVPPGKQVITINGMRFVYDELKDNGRIVKDNGA